MSVAFDGCLVNINDLGRCLQVHYEVSFGIALGEGDDLGCGEFNDEIAEFQASEFA